MLPRSVRALVRNVPTIAPIPQRSILSVTGSHAAEFLNGIVASAIPKSPQNHFFSAFLHAQGRVLYDVFIYAHPSPSGNRGYLIECDSRSSEAPPLLPMLKKYVLRSKVKLRDVTEEYDVWSAWGSDEEKKWETERQWNAVRSGAVEPVWDGEPEWPWGADAGVLRDRRAVGMGHRLLVRKGDKPQEASTHDVASSDDYLLHRILNGVPEGVTDIPPTHAFPMDSNLDIMGALDFRKGCYVGQELTVRTYHTGVLRKRILPVVIHPEDSGDTTADATQFPSDTDIRTHHVSTQDDGAPKPRPRGTGKLLSSIHGVGLALLRLEHVSAVENGTATFELKVDGDDRTWGVSHRWPDWWPRPTLEQE
ncbi:Aminomethyltransferase folate-binding domain-containing protein [Sparassis latifolia]